MCFDKHRGKTEEFSDEFFKETNIIFNFSLAVDTLPPPLFQSSSDFRHIGHTILFKYS